MMHRLGLLPFVGLGLAAVYCVFVAYACRWFTPEDGGEE